MGHYCYFCKRENLVLDSGTALMQFFLSTKNVQTPVSLNTAENKQPIGSHLLSSSAEPKNMTSRLLGRSLLPVFDQAVSWPFFWPWLPFLFFSYFSPLVSLAFCFLFPFHWCTKLHAITSSKTLLPAYAFLLDVFYMRLLEKALLFPQLDSPKEVNCYLQSRKWWVWIKQYSTPSQ